MIPRNQIRPQLRATDGRTHLAHNTAPTPSEVATVLDLIRRHALDAQDAARITAQLGIKAGAR